MTYRSHLTQSLLNLVHEDVFDVVAVYKSITDVAESAYDEFVAYMTSLLREQYGISTEEGGNYYKMEYLLVHDELGDENYIAFDDVPAADEVETLRQHPAYAILHDREISLVHLVDNCETEAALDELLVQMGHFMERHAEELGVQPEAWEFEVLSKLQQEQNKNEELATEGKLPVQLGDPDIVDRFKGFRTELDAEEGRTPQPPKMDKAGKVIKFPRR